MAWVAAKWTGERIDPADLNPVTIARRQRRAAKRRALPLEEQSRIAWRVLDRFFAGA